MKTHKIEKQSHDLTHLLIFKGKVIVMITVLLNVRDILLVTIFELPNFVLMIVLQPLNVSRIALPGLRNLHFQQSMLFT